VSDLIKRITGGDVLAAARLMRDIEDENPDAAGIMESLSAHTGHAFTVGITGVAGSGKSTLIGRLIRYFREQKDMTVGVVAIDPTSAVTGGALLGDRLRMQSEGADGSVFIHSLASRGWKGGLARAAADTVKIMDAMGKDIIFIETVGSGQGDVDVAGVADSCVSLMVPGMGDDIQLMKAGIMEITDIFVVNKADREDSGKLKALLESVISMKERPAGAWIPPVLQTEATTGKGVNELGEEILRHRDYLESSGELEKRRKDKP
jgi:LAO/AO transport system kinase